MNGKEGVASDSLESPNQSDWERILARERQKDIPEQDAEEEQPDFLDNLSEYNRNRYEKISTEIDKLSEESDFATKKAYLDRESVAKYRYFIERSLIGDASADRFFGTLETPSENYAKEWMSRSIEYFSAHDAARSRLEKMIIDEGENLDEITSNGYMEMDRILNPEPGDDLTRMYYMTALLGYGREVQPVPFFKKSDTSAERSDAEFEANRDAINDEIRHLGQFRMLCSKLSGALDRPDLSEMSAVDNLKSSSDAVSRFLKGVNPLRIERPRHSSHVDGRDVPNNMSEIENGNVANLAKILLAGEQVPGIMGAMGDYYSVNELINLSEQEANGYCEFLKHAGAILQKAESMELPEEIRDSLLNIVGWLTLGVAERNDLMERGGLCRDKNGEAAISYLDTALAVAEESLNEGAEKIYAKKLGVMLFACKSGAVKAGDEIGFMQNLFPRMDAGEEEALGLVEDEILPDGTRNLDANKNWSRDFGLGMADYMTACYVGKLNSYNIHELIVKHDSLPSLNKENYFQNREDSRVLGSEENPEQRKAIFYSRDFVHNQMPHAHEVLVFQWAYQKIGRGESFSDEEKRMLSQINETAPGEDMGEEERSEFLVRLGDKFQKFLEANPFLCGTVLGPEGFFIDTEELQEGENESNLSDTHKKLAHERAMQDYIFDLSKYDNTVEVLDMATNERKTEHVSDVLWRLVQNTDKADYETPKIGVADVDEVLSKIELHVNTNGDCTIELRDLKDVMSSINGYLMGNQGKRVMNPDLINGLSFIMRAANYAIKDLPKKELREMFYDPTFKEIVRFHALTWQKEPYSHTQFESLWNRFSSVGFEVDDVERLEHYAVINRMILNQSEELVRVYTARSDQQKELISEDKKKLSEGGVRLSDEKPNEVFYSTYRTMRAVRENLDAHRRQSDMYQNFANSVWSLNLTSTLAKIGSKLI